MTRQRKPGRTLSSREIRRRQQQGGVRAARRMDALAASIPPPPNAGQPWHYWWNPKDARWYQHRPDVIAFITDLAKAQEEQPKRSS